MKAQEKYAFEDAIGHRIDVVLTNMGDSEEVAVNMLEIMRDLAKKAGFIGVQDACSSSIALIEVRT